MNELAVSIRGLGKAYKMNHSAQTFGSLKEFLAQAFSPNKEKAAHPHANIGNMFWSLKDINLDIYKGEILGIIGHNGAGKTTLLKILSQISLPTTGEVKLFGKVGALLGVGTGFHPELTGHENIFLRGAILGMSKSEILDKYDEILEFSEIGDFIHTPIKNYSRGMQSRLGFSVDVHFAPDILILDEVLSVGDVGFRPKSLQKMKEIIHSGCTVIFVSHSTQSIQDVCTRLVWLDHGQVAGDGNVGEIMDQYLQKQVGAVSKPNTNLIKDALKYDE